MCICLPALLRYYLYRVTTKEKKTNIYIYYVSKLKIIEASKMRYISPAVRDLPFSPMSKLNFRVL